MFQFPCSARFSLLFILLTLPRFLLSGATSLRRSGADQNGVLNVTGEKASGFVNVTEDQAVCRVPGTSKLHPGCRGRKMGYVRQGLVTGVGRSGTHTVSALFRGAGLSLPHEKVGRDGSVSWIYAVDAAKVPRAPNDCNWLYPAGVLFRNVIHLSRCPMKTISSLTTFKSCSLLFMMRAKHMNIPALKAIGMIKQPLLTNHLSRSSVMITSARLWLAWTQGVAKQADVHIRVEDLSKPGVLLHLCRSTVGNHPSCARMQYLHVAHVRRKKGNKRKHPDFSFQELAKAAPKLAQKIRAEGTRQGYGWDCFGPLQPGYLGLSIIPGAAAVPLGNNATARLYHQLPEQGNGTDLTAHTLRNASILTGAVAKEELCTCGEDAGWEQDEQDEDDQEDVDLCICVEAQMPGAKELLSAAFDRKLDETSDK